MGALRFAIVPVRHMVGNGTVRPSPEQSVIGRSAYLAASNADHDRGRHMN
jgi:hypothetical protein